MSVLDYRDELNELKAYQTHVHPKGSVVLDANELAEDLPREIKANIAEAMMEVPWNRYPDGAAERLKAAVAQYLGVEPSKLLIGVGSDEVIGMIMHALKESVDVITPTPTFVMSKVTSRAYGHRVIEVPLTQRDDSAWQLDVELMIDTICGPASGLVYLATPNNPTGNAWPDADIEVLISAFPQTFFVLDEAYAPFAGRSLASWVKRFSNVVVLGTLSKVGFAALRVGWLLGSPETIALLEKVRQPYNMNALSQIAASVVLEKDQRWLMKQVSDTIHRRAQLASSLRHICDGAITVYPSDANFLLVEIERARDLFTHLAAKQIFVRAFRVPVLERCLRITVGSDAENETLISAIRAFYDVSS